MAQKDLKVVIELDDRLSRPLDKVSTSISATRNKLTTLGKSFARNARIASVGIIAMGAGITKLVTDAGKFQSVSDAYRNMTESFGINSDDLIRDVKKAVSGTIDEMSVMRNFLKASTLIGEKALGEDAENFERFAVIAKKSARATGQDVDFLFESIVNGIGRTSTKWLDNTGVVVNATDAYKTYGATIGKTAKQLTEEQKKIALTNTFLEKAERLYKDVDVTAGGVSSTIARFKVNMKELGLKIGKELIPPFQEFLEAITKFATDIGPKVVKIVGNLVEKFSNLDPRWQKVILGALAFLPIMVAIGLILMPIIAAFSAFGAVIGIIATVIGGIIHAVGALIAGIALLSAPVLIIIAVVIALIAIGVLLWKNWDTIKEKAGELWEGLTTKFQEGVEAVKAVFSKLWAAITARFDAWRALTLEDMALLFGYLIGTLEAKGAEFQEGWGLFWEGMAISTEEKSKAIEESFGVLMEALKSKVTAETLTIRLRWIEFLDDLKVAIKVASVAIPVIWQLLLTKLKSAVQIELPSIKGLWDTFWTGMKDTVSSAVESIIGFIDKAISKIGSLVGKFKEGRSLGMEFPSFQHGGVVPGGFNQPVPTILHGGERVIPRNGVDVNSGGSSEGVTINFNGSIGIRDDSDIQAIANAVKSVIDREDNLFAQGVL